MMKLKPTIAKIGILVLIALLVGNSRNPILDCADKKAGDPCSSGYSCSTGTCQMIEWKGCAEGQDECLLCR